MEKAKEAEEGKKKWGGGKKRSGKGKDKDEKTTRPVWTGRRKGNQGEAGMHENGYKFYEKMIELLRNVDFGSFGWEEVWVEFWEEEKAKHEEEGEKKGRYYCICGCWRAGCL